MNRGRPERGYPRISGVEYLLDIIKRCVLRNPVASFQAALG